MQGLGSQQPGKPSAAAVAKARGASFNRWPIEKILARGYGVATAWYGDIEPDMSDGLRYGVRKLILKQGQTERQPTTSGGPSPPGPGA